MNPWPPTGAYCIAGERDPAWHDRCTAVGCDCACHASRPPEPSGIRTLTLPVSCPSCGAPLRFVAASRRDSAIRHAVVLDCPTCTAEVQIIATAVQTRPGQSAAALAQRSAMGRRPRPDFLTDDQIARARDLRSSGVSFRTTGAQLGLSGEGVRRILARASARIT